MSDECDQAQDHIEKSMALLMEINNQKAKFVTTNPTGKCLSCAENIGESRRWCDAACRNDWSLQTRQNNVYKGHK